MLGHGLIALLFFRGYLISAHDLGKQTIYSVTLEGGESLGGISQVPDETKKSQAAPPKKTESQPEEVKEVKKEEAEVQIKEEKKEVVKEEKKVEKKEEKKEVKKEEKKVEEKPKETPKKVEEKKAEPKKQESGTDVNKKLQQAMQRYLGESSDAGGKGFGAGSLGPGKGMGGGTVMPPAFHRYKKLLQDKIKGGWRWYDTSAALMSEAVFDISAEGDISNVRISKGSGNYEFDQSVERAILKASPLPPPPPEVFVYFKSVRMIFDPKDL